MNPWALAASPSPGRPAVDRGGDAGGAQDRQLGKKCDSGPAQAPPTSDDLARIDTAVGDVERLCEVVADLRVSLRAGINALAEAGGA